MSRLPGIAQPLASAIGSLARTWAEGAPSSLRPLLLIPRLSDEEAIIMRRPTLSRGAHALRTAVSGTVNALTGARAKEKNTTNDKMYGPVFRRERETRRAKEDA